MFVRCILYRRLSRRLYCRQWTWKPSPAVSCLRTNSYTNVEKLFTERYVKSRDRGFLERKSSAFMKLHSNSMKGSMDSILNQLNRVVHIITNYPLKTNFNIIPFMLRLPSDLFLSGSHNKMLYVSRMIPIHVLGSVATTLKFQSLLRIFNNLN